MQRVLIVGAGGHAQVVADILQRSADLGGVVAPIGYLDDAPPRWGQTLLGLPVFGSIDDRRRVDYDALVVAIGDNSVRSRIFHQLREEGERFATAIHPHATIATGVVIGGGTMICARAVITPGTTIGANVILNTGSTVDHHNQICDHVHIAPGAHLGGDVTVEEGTLIGIGATVMPQIRIGAWSVVGAATLVNRNLPPNVVAVGVPGIVIRSTGLQSRMVSE